MKDPTITFPRETAMRLEIDWALVAYEDCADCWEQTTTSIQALGFVLSALEQEWLEVAFAERWNARNNA